MITDYFKWQIQKLFIRTKNLQTNIIRKVSFWIEFTRTFIWVCIILFVWTRLSFFLLLFLILVVAYHSLSVYKDYKAGNWRGEIRQWRKSKGYHKDYTQKQQHQGREDILK